MRFVCHNRLCSVAMSLSKGRRKGNLLKTLRVTMLSLLSVAVVISVAPSRAQQRSIEIHAHRFEFVPPEITVKKGETVTLSLISDDVTHSLFIEGLGINTTIAKGHPTEVQITPPQAGDFAGRCGRFCGSGHGRMTFVLHVRE
jgi:cytochrome c oxidase subunit II